MLLALLFTQSARAQVETRGVARLMKTWSFTPDEVLRAGYNSKYELNTEIAAPSAISTAAHAISGRKVIRALLATGQNRTEFEWFPPSGTYNENRLYHFNPNAVDSATGRARELWVGFRLRVALRGGTDRISFFQIGPVRHRDRTTSSTGYYQLILDRNNRWVWRIFPEPRDRLAGETDIAYRERMEAADTRHQFSDPQFYENPLNQVRGPVLHAITFSEGREDAWVARLRMTDRPDGRITLWHNGRPILDIRNKTALSTDFTRVKWGPYTGGSTPSASDTTAEYVHLSIAEGSEDGYRLVAPGIYQSFPSNGHFNQAAPLATGANRIVVSGLPFGWSFDPATRVIAGKNSALARGARILIKSLADHRELERVVWIFPGDLESPEADKDHDGAANAAEIAAGTDPHNPASLPVGFGLADTGRFRLIFPRAHAATYRIESTQELHSEGAWTVRTTNPGSTGEMVTWEDPDFLHPTLLPRRFYRLRVTLDDALADSP